VSYAIIEVGGAQHRVSPGDRIKVQRLEGTGNVTLDKVLLVQNGGGVRVGTPYVAGAAVSATVMGEEKGRKVLIFKKKKRKGYRRTNGHRQIFTSLQIDTISAGD
jgi:large subunit ribosomal protein L21